MASCDTANIVKGESNRRKPALSEIAEPPPIFYKYSEKGESNRRKPVLSEITEPPPIFYKYSEKARAIGESLSFRRLPSRIQYLAM